MAMLRLEMKLTDYLAERGETESAFARRSGIPQRTVNRVCTGEYAPRADTAFKIIEATKVEPTSEGGTVLLSDLIPAERLPLGAPTSPVTEGAA